MNLVGKAMKFRLNVSKQKLKGLFLSNLSPECRVKGFISVASGSRSCTCSDMSRVFRAKAISGELYETL